VNRNKYRARRTEFHGESYDSGAEANYAAILELRRKAGQIRCWKRGQIQTLIEGPNRRRRITYRPDFIVTSNDGRSEAIDVKGVLPRDFRLRAILWERKFPDLPLRVVDRDGNVKWSLDG
jgi:hypothetical protein